MTNNTLKLFLAGTILSASGWCTSIDDDATAVDAIFGPGTSNYFSMTGTIKGKSVTLTSVSLKGSASDDSDINLNIVDGEYTFQLTPNGTPGTGSSLFKIGTGGNHKGSLVNLKLDTSAPPNCMSLFAKNNALKTLTFGSKFNTSNVTNMSRMLISCTKLEKISTVPERPCDKLTDGVWDLSGFNLSRVTDISEMVMSEYSIVSTVVVSDKFNPPAGCKYTNGDNDPVFSYSGPKYTLTLKSSSATAEVPVFGTNFKAAIESFMAQGAYRYGAKVVFDTTDPSYVISQHGEESGMAFLVPAPELTESHHKTYYKLNLSTVIDGATNLIANEDDKAILSSPQNVVVLASSEETPNEVEISNKGTKLDVIRASIANDPLTSDLKPKSLKISGAFEFTGYNKFVNAKDTDVTTDRSMIRFVGQNSLFQVPMTFKDSAVVFDGSRGDITFDYPITSIRSSIEVIGNLHLKHEIIVMDIDGVDHQQQQQVK